MADRNAMVHSNGDYGENIFMHPDTSLSDSEAAVQATNFWYNEVSQYDYDNPGFSSSTGHFTQIVWKSSQNLGIGVARSSSGVYVCGSYDPSGNFPGEFPENVLRP